VFEEDAIGTGVGLIRSERIDRLALRRSERGNRRSDEAHSQALRRLELLLHHSGGIYFGNDLKTQLRLASPNLITQLAPRTADWLHRLVRTYQ
jgi:hypothetical protein